MYRTASGRSVQWIWFYGVSITFFLTEFRNFCSSLIRIYPLKWCVKVVKILWRKRKHIIKFHEASKSFRRYRYYYGYFINERTLRYEFFVTLCTLCQWLLYLLSVLCISFFLCCQVFALSLISHIQRRDKQTKWLGYIVYHFSWWRHIIALFFSLERRWKKYNSTEHGKICGEKLTDKTIRALDSCVPFCLSHFVFYGYVVT